MYTGFCMHISYRFSWVNTSEWDCWVIWQVYVYKKLPSCFPKCLYRFAFPLVVDESSTCSTYLLALSIVKIFFYWSIVDLQCHVSFRCTAQWFSYTYIYIYVIYISVKTKYWIYFPVLYSRSLLVIYFLYSSVYMLM